MFAAANAQLLLLLGQVSSQLSIEKQNVISDKTGGGVGTSFRRQIRTKKRESPKRSKSLFHQAKYDNDNPRFAVNRKSQDFSSYYSSSHGSDSGHYTESSSHVYRRGEDKNCRLERQELKQKGMELVKTVNGFVEKQKKTTFPNSNSQKIEFRNPHLSNLTHSSSRNTSSKIPRQQIIPAKEHMKTDNKVIIQIRSNDNNQTISTKPILSKKSASFSHKIHDSRISTDSKGTVRVPVPFVFSDSHSFHVQL